MNKIKGILIDSGRVLNFAATGDWSTSPNFFHIIDKSKFYSIPKAKRKVAYKKAWDYINSIKTMNTIEEEWEHFSGFFTIIAEELPELEIHKDKKKLLIDDFVSNFDKYTFFKDVFDVIPRLSRSYKLCVVSDAWPSLRGVFKKVGVDKYFDSLIISSELGITEPNLQMYKSAIKELDLNEEEVIYIDDNPKNCDGASEMGIKAIILNRDLILRMYYKFILKSPYRIVRNLYDIERLILK